MKDQLFFDFDVNKKNKQIIVKREFKASLSDVWAAWTEAEILDQWWAPKPYQAKTLSLDFSVGGRWFYCMISPEGERHYCIFDFEKIVPLECFTGNDAFCDEDQNISESKPRLYWNNTFQAKENTTLVTISLDFDSEEDLEMIIEMGFKEGFTMGLSNLDEYFSEKN